MKVGFLQFSPQRADVQKNIEQISALLKYQDFDILVLPELANTGYLYETTEDLEIFSESVQSGGPFIDFLIEISKQHGACIVSGIAEKSSDGIYNSSIAVEEHGIFGLYRKVHLYNTEKSLFLPGNLGFPVFSWRSISIGMVICFDWVFPEAMRSLALQGAQIVCHPANLVLPYCQNAMRTRSLENRVFSITANRTGEEIGQGENLHFTGKSQVLSHLGEILVQSDEHSDCVRIVDIEPDLADDKIFSPRNNLLADRRTEYYIYNNTSTNA